MKLGEVLVTEEKAFVLRNECLMCGDLITCDDGCLSLSKDHDAFAIAHSQDRQHFVNGRKSRETIELMLHRYEN